MLKTKRVYDPPSSNDGRRILVDRLWARGVKKGDAAVDEWVEEAALSDELRRWFAHDPSKWDEFSKRYAPELKGKAEWKAQQERICRDAFAKARGAMALAGIPGERVRDVTKTLNTDVAEDIIDEAQDGAYDTIIVGRRGTGMTTSFLMGSVTSKVVHYAKGCAVTIVE